MRFAFAFEPLTPRFARFYVRRRLKELRQKGLVHDYQVRTARIGKFHYKIEIGVDLTPEQARILSRKLMVKVIKEVRR
jgi:hypothetical protein